MKPISLAEFTSETTRTALEDVHTAMPGRVIKYDAATQLADIQPMTKQRFVDAETGEAVFKSRPVLQNVLVQWPRGGPFAMMFPLTEGDEVWLSFGEESISEWRSTGQESEPIDAERHGLSNAVAFPSMSSVARAWGAASATKAVIGHESGARIEMTAAEIDAGPAGMPLAHSIETLASIAALQTAITGLATILTTVSGIAAGLTPPSTPAKLVDITTTLAAFSGAAAIAGTLASGIAAQTPTLPTTVLKGK